MARKALRSHTAKVDLRHSRRTDHFSCRLKLATHDQLKVRLASASDIRRLMTFISGALPSEIVAGFLFLGSAENASNVEQLRGLGITHILNMADELNPHDSVPISQFEYMKCSLNDTVQDRMDNHVDNALAFIGPSRLQYYNLQADLFS